LINANHHFNNAGMTGDMENHFTASAEVLVHKDIEHVESDLDGQFLEPCAANDVGDIEHVESD